LKGISCAESAHGCDDVIPDVTRRVKTNGGTYEPADQIDFIDVGGSKGDYSYGLIKSMYGYEGGLAIDINPKKVKLALENNVPAVRLDASKMGIFSDNACKLVSIVHTLEHLPNLAVVEAVLKSALRVASNTVFIRGPMYYIDYLKPMGFQFYWSHWRGHPCLIEPHKILDIVAKSAISMGWTQDNISHELRFLDRVESSSDPCIHAASGLIDRHDFNPKIDPPKNGFVKFEREIYKEFELVFTLKKDIH
jgi:hypothetical protein